MPNLEIMNKAHRPVPQAVNVEMELMERVGVPVYIVETEVLVVIGDTAIEDVTAVVRAGAEEMVIPCALESRWAGKNKKRSGSRNRR